MEMDPFLLGQKDVFMGKPFSTNSDMSPLFSDDDVLNDAMAEDSGSLFDLVALASSSSIVERKKLNFIFDICFC